MAPLCLVHVLTQRKRKMAANGAFSQTLAYTGKPFATRAVSLTSTPCLPAPPIQVWRGVVRLLHKGGEERREGRQRSDHHAKRTWYYLKLCNTRIVVEIR